MWIEPKTNWAPNDYYNFEDLNRVENNTREVAVLIRYFGEVPQLDVVTDRDMKRIEFANSLNRVEGNMNKLQLRFKQSGWVPNKLDWKSNDPFDYKDAARLENNLALLHFYYRGNIDNFRYCGAYICGEEVI